MKMNFSLLKKGKPIYWVVGGVVLFVAFYLISSKGASGASAVGGGVTTINSGPSESQIAAATQLSIAQLGANASAVQSANDVAIQKAALDAQVAMAQLGYQATLAETQAAADANVLGYQATIKGLDVENSLGIATLNAQKDALYIQSEYSLESAKVASETSLKSQMINANVLSDQLKAQQEMFTKQIDAATYQTTLSIIPTLKKKDRDNALVAIAGAEAGKTIPYRVTNNNLGFVGAIQ